MRHVSVTGYDEWRSKARELLRQGARPEEIAWNNVAQEQPSLFGLFDAPAAGPPSSAVVRVPKEFLEAAPFVACYRSPERWHVLYRVLYHITQGEQDLLQIGADRDARDFLDMHKAVQRDIRRMQAGVQFHRVEADGREEHVAWHQPEHEIVEHVAPSFARRFGAMHWAILTPDRCAYWDTRALRFGPGVSRSPQGGDLEELWRTYSDSVFRPARLSPKSENLNFSLDGIKIFEL